MKKRVVTETDLKQVMEKLVYLQRDHLRSATEIAGVLEDLMLNDRRGISHKEFLRRYEADILWWEEWQERYGVLDFIMKAEKE